MFHRCIFDGNLNAAFDDDVWSGLGDLAEANEDVVLDLSSVDFIDSQGVGAIVSLMKRLSLKGLQLKVQGLHGQPLRLFLDLRLIPVSGVRQTSATTRSAANQPFRGTHPH
jgi:anti-anti-sigma factor